MGLKEILLIELSHDFGEKYYCPFYDIIGKLYLLLGRAPGVTRRCHEMGETVANRLDC